MYFLRYLSWGKNLNHNTGKASSNIWVFDRKLHLKAYSCNTTIRSTFSWNSILISKTYKL